MRGRRPAGPNYVNSLQGSELARERLRIILQTVAGQLSVQEACRILGINPARFHKVRQRALEGALASLEPGKPGRPPRTPSPEQAQIEALQAELAAKDFEIRTAKARQEIAVVIPHVVQPEPAADEVKKKRRGGPDRSRGPDRPRHPQPPRGRPPGKRPRT